MKWYFIFSFILFVAAKASAYVDPGTGSIIVQTLIAALVTGGVLLRVFWKKLFKKRSSDNKDLDFKSVKKISKKQ